MDIIFGNITNLSLTGQKQNYIFKSSTNSQNDINFFIPESSRPPRGEMTPPPEPINIPGILPR